MENMNLEVGQHAVYVDEDRKHHQALITAVWGEPKRSEEGDDNHPWESWPCINLLWVSDEESQQDQYGRQIERRTSVPHAYDSSAPGFCWFLVNQEDAARRLLSEREAGLKS